MHPSVRLTILICDEEQGTAVQDKYLGLFAGFAFGPFYSLLDTDYLARR